MPDYNQAFNQAIRKSSNGPIGWFENHSESQSVRNRSQNHPRLVQVLISWAGILNSWASDVQKWGPDLGSWVWIVTDWVPDLGKLGPDIGHLAGNGTTISITRENINRSWKRHGLGPCLKGRQKEIHLIAFQSFNHVYHLVGTLIRNQPGGFPDSKQVVRNA